MSYHNIQITNEIHPDLEKQGINYYCKRYQDTSRHLDVRITFIPSSEMNNSIVNSILLIEDSLAVYSNVISHYDVESSTRNEHTRFQITYNRQSFISNFRQNNFTVLKQMIKHYTENKLVSRSDMYSYRFTIRLTECGVSFPIQLANRSLKN